MPAASTTATEFTITDLVANYWRFAEQHYQKNGKPTGQLEIVRWSVRPLRELYGSLPVTSFGCRQLKAVRATMLSGGTLCRKEINRRVSVIRRVFRWGVSEDLVPGTVTHTLRELLPLQRGRCPAKDHAEVAAVLDEVVDATLPYLPPVLQDVVMIQRLAGARPGEVLAMRPMDVDRSKEVWRYTPASHKTEHYGRRRVVLIGPRALALLAPYLLRAPETFCFSPTESESRRRAAMRERRRTNVQPSQHKRRTAKPARAPTESYDPRAYNHAVHRAVNRANRQRIHALAKQLGRTPTDKETVQVKLLHWHPNRLRHTAATKIRSAAGLDVVAAVLGHNRPDTSLIYAENDLNKAADIMRQIG